MRMIQRLLAAAFLLFPGGGRIGPRLKGSEEPLRAPKPAFDAAVALAEARRRVLALPVKPQGVKAFLADKRRGANCEL
jgi:hypothetical protein